MTKIDKEQVRKELEQRLGRPPTDEELQLEMDIRLIDSAGGKITKPKKGHKKKK